METIERAAAVQGNAIERLSESVRLLRSSVDSLRDTGSQPLQAGVSLTSAKASQLDGPDAP